MTMTASCTTTDSVLLLYLRGLVGHSHAVLDVLRRRGLHRRFLSIDELLLGPVASLPSLAPWSDCLGLVDLGLGRHEAPSRCPRHCR
jgi:hypothetical protein